MRLVRTLVKGLAVETRSIIASSQMHIRGHERRLRTVNEEHTGKFAPKSYSNHSMIE